MYLDNFFRINMPYGIEKNNDGTWTAFNREFLPIGFSQKEHLSPSGKYNKLPYSSKYKKLTDKLLTEVAYDESCISRNEKGEIVRVCFYKDRSNPENSPGDNTRLFDDYFDKIKRLARIEADF